MRPKSVYIIGLLLLVGIFSFINVFIYTPMKMQAFLDTHEKANNLLVTWKKMEVLTKELLITYDLKTISEEWNATINRFDKEYQLFIMEDVIQNIVRKDESFKLEIERAGIYWAIIHKRLKAASANLKDLIEKNLALVHSGNFLVTFGYDSAAGNYSSSLIKCISSIRSCISLSHVSFTEALTKLSQRASENMRYQNQRLHVNSLILTTFFLILTIGYIVFRINSITRSRLEIEKHAAELKREIDERQKAEETLKTEQTKLKRVLNALGSGMYIVDQNWLVEYYTDTVAGYIGNSQEGKCYEKMAASSQPCAFCLAHKAIEKGTLQVAENILDDGKNWEVIFTPYEDVDNKIKVIVLWNDITEKKQLEIETTRASHLASIGELSAGVAHEINNPINGIINYAEMLVRANELSKVYSEIPLKMIKEGERIASIVKNLLAFAHSSEEKYTLVLIQDIVKAALGLMERQCFKDGIDLIVRLDSNLPPVCGRFHEIQQVFMNIISNARYAILNKYGKGSIEKKLLIIDGKIVVNNDERNIRITFQDNGIGISNSIKDKICNPFFTTKPRGEGTGLGLSISQGIIVDHGGKLMFDSLEGKYTRVIIDLPIDKERYKKNCRYEV